MKNNLRTRLIPILLYKDGVIVKSRKFKIFQTVGMPFAQVSRYSKWNLDELIYLNISQEKKTFYDEENQKIFSTSAGTNYKSKKKIDVFEFIKLLSKNCFMPLAYGGGIDSIEMARKILKNGADKICINSYSFKNKNFITQCAKEFGSQAVIVSIDYKNEENKDIVYIDNGQTNTGERVLDWVKEVEKLGAGEILINSIDNDGIGKGFDNNLYKLVVQNSKIPIVICGGAGNNEHFIEAYRTCKPHALSAANIFQFKEDSYQQTKLFLKKSGMNIR
tara:strand:- start:625 stop:1452 length:828 start_codon:yes stop_codon:yes gene_type:complete